jgi:hypothetical protein
MYTNLLHKEVNICDNQYASCLGNILHGGLSGFWFKPVLLIGGENLGSKQQLIIYFALNKESKNIGI